MCWLDELAIPSQMFVLVCAVRHTNAFGDGVPYGGGCRCGCAQVRLRHAGSAGCVSHAVGVDIAKTGGQGLYVPSTHKFGIQ
ncbi:hypothetical protein C8R45DRAFT_973416, partial [Mycena sanguinolenta]